MNVFMKFVLVAVLGIALPAWAGTASSSKTLLVYETVGQGSNASFSFNAYVAAPLFSAKPTLTNPLIGLSYSLSNNVVPNAGGIGQMPMVPDNPVPTQAALTQAGSQIAQQNYAAIAQAMTAYMAKFGLSSGIFNFQQQVMIQGNPKPGYLTWQMLVDASGRANFGDMQFVTNFPILLYGLYTSQTVDASLPASFAYPNAGTLQWEPIQMPNNNPLLGGTSANFTIIPVSGFSMQTFNVGSTFDTPQSQNGVAVDPDWGLKCLINHNAWTNANATAIDPVCPNVPVNGYTDFMTLLNAQGASGGYLDYTRTLTPVYNAANIPQISVDVTSRTMQNGGFTNCTYNNTYNNSSVFTNSVNACDGVFAVSDETMSEAMLGGACAGSENNYSVEAFPASYTCSDVHGNPVVFMALVSDPNAQQDFANNTNCLYGSCTTFNFSAAAGPPWLPRSSYAPGATDQAASGPSPWLWYKLNGGNVQWDTFLYPTGDLAMPYVVQRNITTDQWGELVPSNINIYPLGGNSGPTYTNSGTIGYQVQSVVDRYYVMPGGAYTLLNELSFPQQAPTQSYSYSVTLPSGATPAGYANIIIDPWGSGQTYDYTNDTVNGLPASAYTVAPIQ